MTFEEGQKMAAEYGLVFIEISARDLSKVAKAFELITESIL